MDIDAAMVYLDFVDERHRVWERRQAGTAGPWSTDPILASRKFTNVFRVLDHGSQFLLGNLLAPGTTSVDVLARSLLYRYTNRPHVWQYTKKILGQWPEINQLYDGTLEQLWLHWRDQLGGQVFSGAYIILPEPGVPGVDKVVSALGLVKRVLDDVAEQFVAADTVADRYRLLRAQRNVGDFMAMQVVTDYGYSEHGAGTTEDEFVVAGPGARRGAAAIGMTPAAAIDWSWQVLRSQPTAPRLHLPGDKVYLPSKMDVQNTFCEFSKYVRYAKGPKPTAGPYRPDHPGKQPPPVLPQHWHQQ